MGRRGFPPQPTALKLLKGNPGRRPLNDREPRADRTKPLCPGWLDDEARKHWRMLAPKLHRMGILSGVDGDVLANYCQTWARWRRTEEFIQKHGDVIPIKDGRSGQLTGFKRMPHVDYANRLLEILHRQQHELGLTPSGRSRIEVSRDVTNEGGLMGLIISGGKKSS